MIQLRWLPNGPEYMADLIYNVLADVTLTWAIH